VYSIEVKHMQYFSSEEIESEKI